MNVDALPAPSVETTRARDDSRDIGGERKGLERFERVLESCESHGLTKLRFDDTLELGRLYRRHVLLLARERQQGDDPEAIRHLNALCVRAFSILYASPDESTAWRRATTEDVARLLSRCWPAILAAWTLLFLGLLVGAALVRQDPDSIHAFIPSQLGYDAELIDRLATSPEAREAFLLRADLSAAQRAIFGSTLFAHNTRVGLLSFAAGILGGVPTALLQLYNGITIGAFTSVFLADPWPVPYLAWLLPHAIPEVTAISLCAAAGLMLGAAVVAPGRQGRRRALRSALAPTICLVGCAIPLFLAAAFLESFVRESQLSTVTRLGIAFALFCSLAGAFVATRRAAKRRHVSTEWLTALSDRVRNEPSSTAPAGSG